MAAQMTSRNYGDRTVHRNTEHTEEVAIQRDQRSEYVREIGAAHVAVATTAEAGTDSGAAVQVGGIVPKRSTWEEAYRSAQMKLPKQLLEV